jgi:hypothetical protein
MRETVVGARNCVASFGEGRSADVIYSEAWIEVKLHVSHLVTCR